MPFSTPHYGLIAFDNGDAYSASADRRRMTTIDNEMSFLVSEMIGDGVIDGWQVMAYSGTTVLVEPGDGLIEGVATFTYGGLLAELRDDKRNYVWMRRKDLLLGDRGAFSPIGSVVYTDSTPPTAPAGLSLVVDYKSVSLVWTANSQPDLDHYEIWRSLDNVTYNKIDDTFSASYVDETVEENTAYWYKLKAVDVNGNVSSFGTTVASATTSDPTVPSDTSGVDVVEGDTRLQLVWDSSVSVIDHYEVDLQLLDSEGLPDGGSLTFYTSANDTSILIDTLANGKRYQLDLFAVTHAGVKSHGVRVYGIPKSSAGPQGIGGVVIHDYALDSSWNVALDVSWTMDFGSYNPPPAYFFVTLAADGQEGLPSIYTTADATIVQYTLKDEQIIRVQQDTKYTLTIQTADENGVTDAGYKIRFRTRKFSPPAPPTGLSLEGEYTINSAKVKSEWQNSNTAFSYYLLSVHRVALDGSTTNLTIEDEKNVGRSISYSIKRADITNKARYDFVVVAVDHDGNRSDSLTGSIVLNTIFSDTTTTTSGDDITGVRPSVPSEQDAIPGNGSVTILWNQYVSDFVKNYNVWRADYTNDGFSATDFSKVATVDADLFQWTDFSVDNGSKYVYFVTVTDLFDRESLNPNDDFIDYAFVYASPRSHSALDRAPAVSVVVNGYDAVVSWDNAGTDFDGYDVYRSDGNSYSFKKVGYAAPDDSSFTDEDALTTNGTYYYMIRRFRNEGELVVTLDRLAPVGSILLASVVVTQGTVTHIDDLRNDIRLLRDPIIAETQRQLAIPHHPYVKSGDDRRIRMPARLTVDDWTTDDFTVYTTISDIRFTTTYHVLVNGDETTVQGHVDADAGTLTFEQPIFTLPTNGSTDGAPDVAVVFDGTQEVTGKLPASQIENVSATKITRGIVSHERLLNYDHFGRYREPLQAAKATLPFGNGFSYAGAVSDSVTFYDVLRSTDDKLIAATSAGVMVNDGNLWTTVLEKSIAPNRLFYTATYGWYLTAIGGTVYYSSDLDNWAPMDGMSGVNSVRDFCEDGVGNLYASTDAGVHVINPSDILKVIWLQTSVIDAQNPGTYALFYESNVVMVGAENGIYSTTNQGTSWTKTSDTGIFVPAHSIVRVGSSLFATTRTNVWRKHNLETSFSIVFSSAEPCGTLAYFAGTLYLQTNRALLKSDNTADLQNALHIGFHVANGNLARNGVMPAVTSLNVSSGRLYIGTDNRLYSLTSAKKLLLHADMGGPAPTIYVGGKVRNIGLTYNATGVHFERPVSPLDKVEVATSYQKLFAPDGGWADDRYDASIFLHINGILAAAGQAKTLSQDVAPVVTGIQLVTFNARNSNFNAALISLKKIVQIGDSINQLDTDVAVGGATVSSLFNEFNTFKANLHPELAAAIKFPELGGILKEVPLSLAGTTVGAFNIDPKTLGNSIGTYNAVGGSVTLETISIDKYSPVELSVRQVGITSTGVLQHSEIEDRFEQINSGLPASFSFITQSNLLKMGTYNRRTWGSEQVDDGKTFQAVYYTPTDSWYDDRRSTIDYSLDIEMPAESVEIVYPADVIEVGAEVWVCGKTGILSINSTTYEKRKVFAHEFYIYNMVLRDSTVYALAEDGLYQINVTSGAVTKDVEIDLPDSFSSIFFINDNTLVATSDGLLNRRPFDIEWHKIIDLKNATIRGQGVFSFIIGQKPTSTTDGQVYYTTGGGSTWNQSATFEGITIRSVARRFDRIYYATDRGIYLEDLSALFSNSDFQKAGIELVDVKGDLDASALVQANDVSADNERVVACDSEGNAYVVEGGAVSIIASELPAIHKVRLVGGKYWLFGYDLVQVEGAETVIRLCTGKLLT